MNEIMTINASAISSIKNHELLKATTQMSAIANKLKKNLFEVASILAKVEETECYKEDGFKSTADYAMKVFGIKKSVAYNMIRVGIDFTDRKALSSNLPHDEKDYTVTQIAELARAGKDKAVELAETGVVSPAMTCAEIRNIVDGEVKKPERKNTAKEVFYNVDFKGTLSGELPDTMTLKQIDEMCNQGVFSKSFKGADGLKRHYIEYDTDVVVIVVKGKTEVQEKGE